MGFCRARPLFIRSFGLSILEFYSDPNLNSPFEKLTNVNIVGDMIFSEIEILGKQNEQNCKFHSLKMGRMKNLDIFRGLNLFKFESFGLNVEKWIIQSTKLTILGKIKVFIKKYNIEKLLDFHQASVAQ